MEPQCPDCGASHKQGDLFCRRCGTKLPARSGVEGANTSCEEDLLVFVDNLKEFRAWIGQQRRKNIRFMKTYKERMQGNLAPAMRKLAEKYGSPEEPQSPLLSLVNDAFSALNRPIAFMETELRPSVGMGVFLERWMMRDVVERCLKDCCEEADRHLEVLEETMGSES
jgi:hypothetical protein